jgi:hypothetical protein
MKRRQIRKRGGSSKKHIHFDKTPSLSWEHDPNLKSVGEWKPTPYIHTVKKTKMPKCPKGYRRDKKTRKCKPKTKK